MNTKSTTRTAAIITLVIGATLAGGCSTTEETSSKSPTSRTAGPAPAAPAAAGPAAPIPSSPPTTMKVQGGGEVVLRGAIAGKYQQMGGEKVLGSPTGQPKQVGDGTVQPFAKGTIYSSPSTGAHVVWGKVLETYQSNGGPTGSLGFPTTDEYEVDGGPKVAHGGWGNEFERGYVWWIRLSDKSNAFESYVTKK